MKVNLFAILRREVREGRLRVMREEDDNDVNGMKEESGGKKVIPSGGCSMRKEHNIIRIVQGANEINVYYIASNTSLGKCYKQAIDV